MSLHKQHAHAVVIIGATNELGYELAKCYLRSGVNVVMADHAVAKLCNDVESLSVINPQQKVVGVVCDTKNMEQVRNLVKQTYAHFQQISALFIQESATPQQGLFWELTPEHISRVMGTDVLGMVQLIQTFMPFLLKQQVRCRIINIASVYALCNGSHMTAHTVLHHAMLALSESLYFDLLRQGLPIDVSVVCPFNALKNSAITKKIGLFTEQLQQLLYTPTQAFNTKTAGIAAQILQGIEDKIFYIIPGADKQVLLNYTQARLEAIRDGMPPPYEYAEAQSAVAVKGVNAQTGAPA